MSDVQLSHNNVRLFFTPSASNTACTIQNRQIAIDSAIIAPLKSLGSFSDFKSSLMPMIEIKIQERIARVKRPLTGFVVWTKERTTAIGNAKSGVFRCVLTYFVAVLRLITEKTASHNRGRLSSKCIEEFSPNFRFGKKEKKRTRGRQRIISLLKFFAGFFFV